MQLLEAPKTTYSLPLPQKSQMPKVLAVRENVLANSNLTAEAQQILSKVALTNPELAKTTSETAHRLH